MTEYKERLRISKVNLINWKSLFFEIIQIFISIILPLLIIVLWEYYGEKGVIKQSILPSPSVIGSALMNLITTGNLWKHSSVTLFRVFQGYLYGALLGIAVGIAMGLFKTLDRLLSVLTGLLRPVPMVAWIPVFILWLGMDEVSKISVIVLGTFWPVWLNVLSGIKNTDIKYIEIGKVLKKDKFTVLTSIIIPSALPSIFNGLRVGVAVAWSSVITAELISGTIGLGFMIQYARQLIQPDVMLAGVFIVGMIGFLFDFILRKLERRLLRWNVSLGSK